jgi:hypothetical protein
MLEPVLMISQRSEKETPRRPSRYVENGSVTLTRYLGGTNLSGKTLTQEAVEGRYPAELTSRSTLAEVVAG